MKKQIIFKGHVQGVGFRYSVKQIAYAYEIDGSVQNLANGAVKVIAEGDTEEISGFINEVKAEMAGFIREIEENEIKVMGESLGGFRVIL